MSKTQDKIAGIKQSITASFIEALEQGLAHPESWQAPWHTGALRGAVNAATGRRYHGGNALRADPADRAHRPLGHLPGPRR